MAQLKTIAAIDLSHLFWTNWHASADQQIGEAFNRTVRSVKRIASQHDHVAICCDSPPYWRKQIHADYKAQRDRPEPAAVEQFRRVQERLAADGFLLWRAPGYEADDIIAGFASWVRQLDEFPDALNMVVASNDKDLLQLVCDGVRVYSTKTDLLLDEAAVEAKFGVKPALFRDMLALWGDTSDNVPGVPGIGPKKAAELLLRWGSLEAVMVAAEEQPEEFKPATLRALKECRASVLLARQLVTLKTDAAINYDELFEERKVIPLANTEDAEFEDAPDQNGAAPPEINGPDHGQAQQTEQSKQAVNEAEFSDPKTAIVRHEGNWSLALEPRTEKNAWTLSKVLHNSRLYSQFSSAEAIMAVMMRGRAMGLDCTTALSTFHVIEGRPCMHASLIVGLVLKSGKAEYFDPVEMANDKCTWVTKRVGSKHEVRLSFTVEDAVAMGVLERSGNGQYRGVSKSGKPSNWDKHRRTMLKWRAATELARTVYPDIVNGLYTPDELSDGQAEHVDPAA